MSACTSVLLFASACLAQVPPSTVEQAPGAVDLTVAGAVTNLLGVPVIAADGQRIGEVADVSVPEDGQPARIRITTGAILGFGARTLELPRNAFTISKGTVVLDLPSEAVQALPAVPEPAREK
jgi:sporulation protein YlmC with PRC-barrel domain